LQHSPIDTQCVALQRIWRTLFTQVLDRKNRLALCLLNDLFSKQCYLMPLFYYALLGLICGTIIA